MDLLYKETLIKKQLIFTAYIFKKHGLDIVIECNKKIVDNLDVTLNLNDGSYRPFHKLDDIKNYIHIQSNHHKIFTIDLLMF